MAAIDAPDLSLWAVVGVLQLLLGVAWVVALRRSVAPRRALLAMAGFNGLVGASLLLLAWRGGGPHILTHGVASLLQVVGGVLLWRAGCGLTGAPLHRAEQRRLLLLAGGAVLLLGMSPETEAGWIVVSLLANAWLAARAGIQVAGQLRRQGASRPALTVLLCAILAATVLVARALGASVLGNDIDQHLFGGVAMAALLLVPMMVINLVAIGLARGGAGSKVNPLAPQESLTGLADAATLNGVLAQEWRRLRQWGSPVVLLEMRVDQFGTLREEFGTDTADTVLAPLAWQLKLGLRAGDVLAHCGGGVFRVVLPGTRRPEALALAQHLLVKVGSGVGQQPESDQRLTLSIGLAEADGDDQGPQAVLRRAQAQAQVARLGGGDRVVADSPAPQPQTMRGEGATAG
jgi:diguanylate cyclase (GGDEF)-like protein